MRAVQGYSVPHLRLPLLGGLHSSPGLSGVYLGQVESCPALILALLAQANNPRRLVHVNDDSDVDSYSCPDAALLGGIPGRIPSDRLLAPHLGLMVSRYPRGYAFTATLAGQELHLHETEVIKERPASNQLTRRLFPDSLSPVML